MPPVTLIVIGAGSRGTGYGRYAIEHPDQAKVVGVAEPREFYRNRLVETHAIPPENVAADWREMAGRPKRADAVLICTQDHLHTEPAVAFLKKGYHVLLEKPMGQTEKDCRRIAAAAIEAKVLFAVCHVLRYTAYTKKLREIIDSGVLGDVVSLQHLENVGYWHQAHSFVRGNWAKEGRSSPMLLSKSCHDLDWIRHIMGSPCRSVSSFGSLYHFRKEHRPAGAADRCLVCPVEPQCPYSARRIYLGRLARGETGWPLDTVTSDLTPQGVTEALRTGPYGRCVYACDNDVVDHQVVNMLFEGGKTATFTMTAFNRAADRETRLFGTRGELHGNGRRIEHFDFLTEKTVTLDTQETDLASGYPHGGGDYGLMNAFVSAVATGDAAKILTGARETLETHLMIFCAEKARRENGVVEVRV